MNQISSDLMNEQVTTHIKRREMACPCCGIVIINRPFVDMLESFRQLMGIPFYYSEGGFCRCPAYNASLPNSSKSSFHLEGKAADIKLASFSAEQRWEFVRCAQFMKFSIGSYSAHFHIDLRPGPPIYFIGHY